MTIRTRGSLRTSSNTYLGARRPRTGSGRSATTAKAWSSCWLRGSSRHTRRSATATAAGYRLRWWVEYYSNQSSISCYVSPVYIQHDAPRVRVPPSHNSFRICSTAFIFFTHSMSQVAKTRNSRNLVKLYGFRDISSNELGEHFFKRWLCIRPFSYLN